MKYVRCGNRERSGPHYRAMGDNRDGLEGVTTCPRFREALSARLDGEDPGMPDELIDSHVLRCADCASFAEAIAGLHRRSRIGSARPIPDLSTQILARLPNKRWTASQGRSGTFATRRLGDLWADRPLRTRVAALFLAVGVAAGAFAGGGALAADLRGGRSTVGSSFVAGTPPQLGVQGTHTLYPGATVLADDVVKPDVQLTDTAGQPYDMAKATAGRVTLLYFGYTHCPDLCPINMALDAAAIRELPDAIRQKVDVVFITTDPRRDSETVLRKWLDNFDPAFVGLTGSVAAIHHAELEVDMPLSYAVTERGEVHTDASYQVVHAGYTLVYALDGRADIQVDDSDRPAELAATIEHLVTSSTRRAR